jgi:uncharacterized protein YhfF
MLDGRRPGAMPKASMSSRKVSLYADGAVGIDGQLFATPAAAEPTLRRYAAMRPPPAFSLAIATPGDYEAIGAIIYAGARAGIKWEHHLAGVTVDARPRNKRLTFWGADDNDDSLVLDVIAGRKTVTADTVDAYYQPYGPFGDGSYAAGDLIDVHDLKQRLRCTIRATKVYTIRFGDIPEEVWRGENFSSADQFRQVHIDALPHLDLHDAFELVTLHFELVDVAGHH